MKFRNRMICLLGLSALAASPLLFAQNQTADSAQAQTNQAADPAVSAQQRHDDAAARKAARRAEAAREREQARKQGKLGGSEEEEEAPARR